MEGSLAGFTLLEVLEMLSATKKSGVLSIAADQDRAGRIGLNAGRLGVADSAGSVKAAVDSAEKLRDKLENAIVEMLSWENSSFRFEARTKDDKTETGPSFEAAQVLTQVAAKQAEWEMIRKEIPSLKARVELIVEVDAEKISLTRDDWMVLALAGKKATIEEIQRSLNLGQLAICRSLYEMSKKGLIRCLGEVVEVAPDPPEEDEGELARSKGRKYIRRSLHSEDAAAHVVPAEWASYYQLLDSRKCASKAAPAGRALEH